jgi:aryl-alcohol dehydrogenase-like predicted oxidoreductase
MVPDAPSVLASIEPVGRTHLTRSRLELSRIGLGLANMHLLSREADRVRLIKRAFDLGITHFDTARFYGDGMSETTLGRFLPKNRGAITIATKFGLLPTPLIGSLGNFAPPFRKARSLLNKLGIVPYPRRSYTRETLRKSLEASLRALKTDYIDIYHLHEPLLNSDVREDVFEELERSKEKGWIRFIGVSGAYIDNIVARFGSSLDVIQSAEASWSEFRSVPDITHSLFSDALRAKAAEMGSDSIRQLLERALLRRQTGSVIVQTRHPRHLEQLVGWAAGK